MKRVLKIIVVVLFVAFIVVQFIRPNMTNPPVVAEQTLEASTQLPENVKTILSRSCADCHTNSTVYPWYAQISPFSWFLADHIKDGRREVNFSEWATFEDRRKKRKLQEICEQVETREMPLPSYLWIHWDAKMSDEEIRIVCDWTKTEINKLSANAENK
jgi:Haem-binding domain